MKHILGCIRQADGDFNMIGDGDRIAVGLSGGKDSTLLLLALHEYAAFSANRFTLHALMVDLGFPGFDDAPHRALCESLGIPLTVVATQIGDIVFSERREKNPCALCAKLRKGAFYAKAKELGLNKAAFAHHREDVIETFLMSLLYEGRISTFSPVTHLERSGITLIRPFIYVGEKQIISLVRRLRLPVIQNACPACGHTRRTEMKELMKSLTVRYPKARDRILSALRNTAQYNLWDGAGGGDE